MHPRDLLSTTFLCVALTGCSDLKRVAGGPVVAFGDAHPSAGGALVVESAIGGTSEHDWFVGVGAGARGAITSHAADVAPFVGPRAANSIGPVLVDGSLRVGPGLQVDDGRLLAFGSAGAALGAGVPIADSGWRPFYPLGIEAAHPMPRGGRDLNALIEGEEQRQRGQRTRSRTLLTFGVAADVDLRFTRSPLYVLGLFAGLTWMDDVK